MWFPNAFWPALFATLLGAIIIAMLLKSGIKKPGNTAAFMLFISFFIWSFGEMIERMAGPPPYDAETAWTGVKLIMIGISLTPAAFLHFSFDYPEVMWAAWRKKILAFAYSISLIMCIFSVINPRNAVVSDVSPYEGLGQTIWGIVASKIYVTYTLYAFLMSISFISIMLFRYTKTKMKIMKKQIFFSLTGFMLAVVLVAISAVIPMLKGENAYPLTTVSFSIFSVFVLYTVFRYRTFLVPVKKYTGKADSGFHISGRERAFMSLKNAVERDIPAVAFIPEDSEKFKKKLGKDIPVFQICEKLGADRLNPIKEEHMEMMRFIIESFVESSGSALVFVDMKEYMMEAGGEQAYMKLLDEFKKMRKNRRISFIIAE